MEQKKRLFDHLYMILHGQILNGYLKYGTLLPSITQLSEMYNVGIRTVRNVLDALNEENLIQTRERKRAVVIYGQPELEQNISVRSILESKTSVIEVYKTITILIPHLISFSAQICDEEDIKRVHVYLTSKNLTSSEYLWRTCSKLIHDLLDSSGNLLFRKIYTNLEIHAQVPFFVEHRRQLSLIASHNEYADPITAVKTLNGRNPNDIYCQFCSMYSSFTEIIELYLDDLSSSFPNYKEDRKLTYFWDAEQGRDHYYMQIVRDVIDKIGLRIYEDGKLMPSERELAEQYHVSVSTIRKAVSILNELGFARTFNGKGTHAILSDDQLTFQCMKNKSYKRDTLLYLSGLQFMSIAVRPVVFLTFERFDKEVKQDLCMRLQKPDVIPLDCLIHCLIEQIPLSPLKVILLKVNKLLHWGYYFSFYEDGSMADNELNKKTIKAFEYLMLGKKSDFADQLSLCYCHILNVVRDFMIGCGLPEAAEIVTPNFQITA